MVTYITEIKIYKLESHEEGTYQKTDTIMRAIIANNDYNEMRIDLARRLGTLDGEMVLSRERR